jgi:hypothetical protein
MKIKLKFIAFECGLLLFPIEIHNEEPELTNYKAFLGIQDDSHMTHIHLFYFSVTIKK